MSLLKRFLAWVPPAFRAGWILVPVGMLLGLPFLWVEPQLTLTIWLTGSIALAVLLASSLVLRTVLRDPVTGKPAWETPHRPVVCPYCQTPPPRIRRPQSLQQFLRGGWTCECGKVLNNWGQPVEDPFAHN
ncbi:MAG: hypothetical protein JJ896_14285 [Rhodothermales bacterium]|nr:hypothetical protein [Rhodothermales bacterium]MBO6780818.1 hypothetical protein [Rhodothermales bacterium]